MLGAVLVDFGLQLFGQQFKVDGLQRMVKRRFQVGSAQFRRFGNVVVFPEVAAEINGAGQLPGNAGNFLRRGVRVWLLTLGLRNWSIWACITSASFRSFAARSGLPVGGAGLAGRHA